jgi:hypothetical protein
VGLHRAFVETVAGGGQAHEGQGVEARPPAAVVRAWAGGCCFDNFFVTEKFITLEKSFDSDNY